MPSRKMSIRWCRELKYLNRDLPNYSDYKAGDFYSEYQSKQILTPIYR